MISLIKFQSPDRNCFSPAGLAPQYTQFKVFKTFIVSLFKIERMCEIRLHQEKFQKCLRVCVLCLWKRRELSSFCPCWDICLSTSHLCVKYYLKNMYLLLGHIIHIVYKRGYKYRVECKIWFKQIPPYLKNMYTKSSCFFNMRRIRGNILFKVANALMAHKIKIAHRDWLGMYN